MILLFIVLLYHDISEAFTCPDFGLRFKGETLENSKDFLPGWQYWKQCSERCQANPDCNFWTMSWDSQYSDSKNRVHCQLFKNGDNYDRPTNQPQVVFYSGERNCQWSEPVPPETVCICI